MNLLKSTVLLLVYGRFSHTFHKHYFKDGSLTKSRHKYLRPCSRNDALSHYWKCMAGKDDLAILKSNDELKFGHVKFGISFYKMRIRKSDYKCFDVEKYAGHIWKRIGYREKIRNEVAKRIFHFLDGEFFFGELLYSDIRKIDLENIANALVKKYTGKNYHYHNGDIRINLANGFIYFENSGIHLSIKYISTASEQVNEKLSHIFTIKGVNLKPIPNEAFDVL